MAGLVGLALSQPLQVRAANRHSGALPLIISAVGSVHNPADKITITLGLNSAAENDGTARIARLRRLLTAEGVSPSGIVDNAPPRGPARPGGHVPTPAIRVLIEDPKIYQKVRKVLIEQGVVLLAPPLFELKDGSAAKAAAVTDAIQKAQTEADIYATAAGNRVIRVTRMENKAPTRNVDSSPKAAVHVPAATLPVDLPDVVTEAPVTLTFAMVPG
jgi:uncharacterized protein YggE